MSTEEVNRARELARAVLEQVVTKVKRLEHAEDCPGDESCEATDGEVFAGLHLRHDGALTATTKERQEYHDEEAARQDILDRSYSVECRSDWTITGQALEGSEYRVLLAGGGPAAHIIGDLDHSVPYTARLEYQDWFTPWEELLGIEIEEREALLKYASQFYFGD